MPGSTLSPRRPTTCPTRTWCTSPGSSSTSTPPSTPSSTTSSPPSTGRRSRRHSSLHQNAAGMQILNWAYLLKVYSKYSVTTRVCKDNPDSIAIPTQLAQVPHYMLVYSQDQTLEHAFVFSGTVPSQLPILWPLIFSSQ